MPQYEIKLKKGHYGTRVIETLVIEAETKAEAVEKARPRMRELNCVRFSWPSIHDPDKDKTNKSLEATCKKSGR